MLDLQDMPEIPRHSKTKTNKKIPKIPGHLRGLKFFSDVTCCQLIDKPQYKSFLGMTFNSYVDVQGMIIN